MVWIAVAALISVEPRIELDKIYSRAGGEELKMDIYFPANAGKPAPAVLVIHGGGWMGGKRTEMADIAKALAGQGFVAATTSYRLAPKFKWPAMLDDVQTAIRFLRKNAAEFNLDPKRIGSCGASAGGQLALHLGFRETNDKNPSEYSGFSSKTQAVFNIFGPTDFRYDFAPSVEPLFVAVLGKKREQAAEEIRHASPVEWVDANDAPVFTLHGDADPLVPVEQSRRLKRKLDGAGVENELRIVPKMAHGIDRSKPEQLQGMKDGSDWLKRHLRP